MEKETENCNCVPSKQTTERVFSTSARVAVYVFNLANRVKIAFALPPKSTSFDALPTWLLQMHKVRLTHIWTFIDMLLWVSILLLQSLMFLSWLTAVEWSYGRGLWPSIQTDEWLTGRSALVNYITIGIIFIHKQLLNGWAIIAASRVHIFNPVMFRIGSWHFSPHNNTVWINR